MFGGQFPAFLVAREEHALREAIGPITVRVRWQAGSWFVEDAHFNRELFSFDLPPELFRLYAERGRLNQENVANLKSDMMRELFAFFSDDEGVRLVTFRLDEPWFNAIRQHLHG
jgi:hypothetical protein